MTMPTPEIAKAAEEIAQERLRALPLFVLEYLAPMQCMSAERAELVRRLNENIPVPGAAGE